jgi:AcrR family transcriptional regulator
MSRTQDERKAETKARLLDAAADLFALEGFHATSTDAVADAADRTSGAVYAHFGGKEGLLLALLDAWEHRTATEMGARLSGASTPAERLEAMWTTFARPPVEGGDAGMLLEHELWLYAARNPIAADELAQRYAQGRRAIAASFDDWAAGHHRELPMPADDLAVIVMALLMGLEMQHRVEPAAVPDELATAALHRLTDSQPT